MLAEAFLAACPDADPDGLDEVLREIVDAARTAHRFAIDDVAFVRYLAAHADERPRSLRERNLGDAYLACAILHRDPAALALYTSRLEPAVRAVVARIVADADDVLADVRAKLVIDGRIADYGGRGELLVWIRVIAIRAALTRLRAQQKYVPTDDQLWELASPDADPALVARRRQCSAHVKAAFHAGLAALTPRQRNLLRQHLLDGLTIDELGAIYNVHRVTAARWLVAARTDLWSHVRRRLRDTLGLSDTSIGDMLEDIRSTLDLSIERALT